MHTKKCQTNAQPNELYRGPRYCISLTHINEFERATHKKNKKKTAFKKKSIRTPCPDDPDGQEVE
jgi:hypothetical protein